MARDKEPVKKNNYSRYWWSSLKIVSTLKD